METENSTFIRGPIERVYDLAANIQDWPTLLPHYRAVNVVEQTNDGNRKIVEMCAVRQGYPSRGMDFPVSWRSVQVCEPTERRIIFKHIGGVACGMWVEWNIAEDPWGRGVHVSIRHRLRYPLSLLDGWFGTEVVGNSFVTPIAGRTLATIKGIVEGEN